MKVGCRVTASEIRRNRYIVVVEERMLIGETTKQRVPKRKQQIVILCSARKIDASIHIATTKIIDQQDIVQSRSAIMTSMKGAIREMSGKEPVVWSELANQHNVHI